MIEDWVEKGHAVPSRNLICFCLLHVDLDDSTSHCLTLMAAQSHLCLPAISSQLADKQQSISDTYSSTTAVSVTNVRLIQNIKLLTKSVNCSEYEMTGGSASQMAKEDSWNLIPGRTRSQMKRSEGELK